MEGGLLRREALLRFPKTLNVLINLDRLKSTKAGPFIDHLVNSMGLVTFRGQPDDIYLGVSQPIQRVGANLIMRSGEAPRLIDLTLRELENTMKPGAPPPSRDSVPPHIASLFDRMRSELKPGFVREDGVTTSQPLTALYHIAKDKSIVPRLIPLLRHPAIVPRIYVAMTLGKLRATEALPAILEIIREGYPFSDSVALASGKHFDQSQTVRWRGFLCMALGKMGGDEARQALETFATDAKATRDIRYGAVVGLGFIGSPKSLPALKKVAQEDVIWMVRDTAKQILAEIELVNGKGE